MSPKIAVAAVALVLATSVAQELDLRKEFDAVFQKGLAFRRAGKHIEAIVELKKAWKLAPTVFGPEHARTADVVEVLGQAYLDTSQYREAESHLRQCLDMQDKAMGKDHRSLAVTLNNLARACQGLHRFDEAEAYFLRCLEITDAKFARDDPVVGIPMHNFAWLYHETGRYGEAELMLKRALKVQEHKDPAGNLELATSLNTLAIIHMAQGRLHEAEAAARRGLQIIEARLGKDHLGTANQLTTLAQILERKGRVGEAVLLYQRCLTMRESRLAKDHPDVARSLGNLGDIYAGMGRYREAEPMLRRSVAIQEARFGKDSLEAAQSLTKLGNLCRDIGRPDEALSFFRRSVAIYEATLGKDHPDVLLPLSSLAGLLGPMGKTDEAERLYRRGIEIAEARLGKDHPSVASCLHNLAYLYTEMKRYRDAEPLFRRSLAIKEKRHGKESPAIASTLADLGLVYRRTKQFDKAEAHLQKALEILRAHDEPSKRWTSFTLYFLASVNLAVNRPQAAMKIQEEMFELEEDGVRNVLSFSSEAAMHDFLETRANDLPLLINIAAAPGQAETAPSAALTWTLRRKGIVLDTMCRYRQAQHLLTAGGPLAERASRYRSLKQQLADVAVNPPKDLDSEKLDAQVKGWRKESENLEAELNRAIAGQPEGKAEDAVSTETVQKRLAPGSALVEFLSVARYEPQTDGWLLPPKYYAFVLRPGKARPQLIDLGLSHEIDAGISAVRDAMAQLQEKLKECDSPEEAIAVEKAQEEQFRKKAAALSARLFEPLRPALGDARMVYLAADGALNRLPFEALVDADGKYLIESYRFAYLSSGRDLVRPHVAPGKGTVVIAGPDYRLSADERLARAAKLSPRKETVALRGSSSQELRGIGWKALPGAAAEAGDIQKTLQDTGYGPVKTYLGPDALEEVLKSVVAPRVLHLATHGFFLDHEPKAPAAEDPADLGAGAGSARGRLKRIDNPLLRSGIVLAGANAIGDKEAARQAEDGWVTAEEIALLNLRGTELVVLSACQTGLGDIKSGEGVYGLRRAFLYAGARTLVTSLFEVPDQATRDLMQRFYRGLSSGQGKLTALHTAQKELLQQRREKHKAAHPFFWASFVLVGEPD